MSFTGRIYSISCLDETIRNVYVGSTKKTLKERFSSHIAQSKTKYIIPAQKFIIENGGFENWKINLLEESNFDSVKNMRMKEEFHRLIYLPNVLNRQRAINSCSHGRSRMSLCSICAPEDYEISRQRWKSYVHPNPEKKKENQRNSWKNYQRDNADKVRKASLDWYHRNREVQKEKQRERYRLKMLEIK